MKKTFKTYLRSQRMTGGISEEILGVIFGANVEGIFRKIPTERQFKRTSLEIFGDVFELEDVLTGYPSLMDKSLDRILEEFGPSLKISQRFFGGVQMVSEIFFWRNLIYVVLLGKIQVEFLRYP